MSSDRDTSNSDRPSVVLRIAFPLLVAVIGVAVAFWLMRTGPQAKQRPKTRNALLVEVREVERVPQQTTLSVMGTVKPSREVLLKPQVSGPVIALSPEFLPGGHFRTGDLLLRIDPADYQLAVEQLTSEVARVETELRLEQGNQLVAQKEYELFGEEASAAERELMLRQPQLDSLTASLAVARSRLEKARLDLERTRILAPFNAIVASREINLGTNVSESTTLARLLGTDAYWVEVSVPVSQLRWIRIPQENGAEGSPVKIFDEAAWGEGLFREGRVIRLAAALEAQGRMARLLVEVKDPLARQPDQKGLPHLLIDSYVRAEIAGDTVDSAVSLARTELHDGDTVWVLSPENTLDIRSVEITFRGKERVLVTNGLETGDRLITSNLPTPVAGMTLRLAGDDTARPASAVTNGGATRP